MAHHYAWLLVGIKSNKLTWILVKSIPVNIWEASSESFGLLSVIMTTIWLDETDVKLWWSMDKNFVLPVDAFRTNLCIATLNELTSVVDDFWYFDPKKTQNCDIKYIDFSQIKYEIKM